MMQSSTFLHPFQVPPTEPLTEEGVGETVPPAPQVPDQPSAVEAGGETKGGPEEAHQHVADADVQQDQVDRRPETMKLRKYHENKKIVEDAENKNKPEANCDHRVSSATQSGRVLYQSVPHFMAAQIGLGAVNGAQIPALAHVHNHTTVRPGPPA